MKISVIIPVYNVERYLCQCVDSVLAQDYTDLEIILVDDGSQDRCGAICDRYAEKDGRIHVIHKANGGLSDARNAGVSAATGEYVLFLDGDDLWGDSHAVTVLANRIAQTHPDVLHFSYMKWFADTGRKEPYFQNVPDMPEGITLPEQLKYLTDRGLYIASACNKLIRRSLLAELPFERGVYSEDICWCAQLMLRAGSMDFICANFYLYRQRSDSIRHTINDKKCKDLTNHILACMELADQAREEVKDSLLRYIAFQLGTFFAVQAQAENPQPECIKQLEKVRWVLGYHGGNRKVQILNLGCKMISFPLVCKVIRLFYHN